MEHVCAFRQSQYCDCQTVGLGFSIFWFFFLFFFYKSRGENAMFYDIRADCSFVYKKTKERGNEDGTF